MNHSGKIKTPIDHNFHLISNEKVKRREASLSPAYRRYRAKWNEYPCKHILDPFPLHLDIEATNQCNLKCIMCPRTDMVQKNQFWPIGSLSYDFFRELVDQGVPRGLCSLKFNYYGEPTLHPRLTDMVRYAKSRGVVDVMFNTNATLLTADLSRAIVASGLDQLFFSFDSPYPDDYNKIRVGADFHRVLDNIKRFMEIRNALHSISPFTRVTMVWMKDNDLQREDFKTLFEPIVDAVAFADYLDHNGQQNPERMLVSVGKQTQKFCCPQLWQRMFIHPDGACTVCCMDATRSMIVGNAFEKSVCDIWLGTAYQRIRALHAAGRFEECPTCDRCVLAHYQM